VSAEVLKTNTETNSNRAVSAAKWTGKLIAATTLVCLTATPFVRYWADHIKETTADPVTERLDGVTNSVGNASNDISGKLGTLNDTISPLTLLAPENVESNPQNTADQPTEEQLPEPTTIEP
jgi:hypothetical protein